jgi:hypothetical protein
MIEIALHRSLSWVIASFGVRPWGQGDTSIPAADGEIKAPTSVAPIWLGEWVK